MKTAADTAAVARGLTKRYPNGVVALDQLDLEIERASIAALIGNNGSGKTTFLKILAGLLTPDGGSARVLDCDPAMRDVRLRAKLGYVSQAVELDTEMTVLETLRLFAALYRVPRTTSHAAIAALAESLVLDEHLSRLVSTLSGGLRQRLHLALGLLHQPELLLLDEPTAALDPPVRSFVWQFLQRLRDQGRTIVVVSHDLTEVSQHCQAIALLHKGRLLARGSPAEVSAAHANWRLEIELAGPAAQDMPSFLRAASLPGVKSVSARDRQLVAYFAARDAGAVERVREDLLQQVARIHGGVLGYRLHPPDLASAYFELTGATIENTGSGKGAGAMTRQ
jgi:ABC-type multidrug transport system ATPase subunit